MFSTSHEVIRQIRNVLAKKTACWGDRPSLEEGDEKKAVRLYLTLISV